MEMNSGIRASYKSALLFSNHLTPNKYLQFIKVAKRFSDPDSYINNNSIKNFIKILKNPNFKLVDFIFEQTSSTIDL